MRNPGKHRWRTMTSESPIRDISAAERANLIPQQYAVGVAGYAGAGKTTVSKLFQEELDAVYANSGDQVRSHAIEALGEDVTSEEIGSWIHERIEEHGTRLVSEWLVSDIESAEPTTYAVIDGVRKMPETELTSCFDRFYVVLVHADNADRYQRIETRNKPRENVSGESAHTERDEREETYGLTELYEEETYDFFIQNDGSIESLKDSVAEIASKLP